MYCQIMINGVVQGIGFRPFVYNLAIRHKLVGFVLNRGDAGVEIQIKGSKGQILTFIDELQHLKPPLARYEKFDTNFDIASIDNAYLTKFQIAESTLTRGNEGSYIPPDLPICEKCINEMGFDQRRLNYPFTSCVDCGPRYSVISSLPYDRPRTVMEDFPLCSTCLGEYTNPTDRRFHAQTTCCWECGPQYRLLDNKGNIILSPEDFRRNVNIPSKLLNEGNIIAIKGIGGTHIACRTMLDDPILKIRDWKGARGEKPFAVMSKNQRTTQQFAHCSLLEANYLNSYIRPILLLDKNDQYTLSEYISPNLHNIGVLFPYAGIHVTLFHSINDPALVMTSGNPSNMPILIRNSQIQKNLSTVADYFLLHDRTIYQRIDDSVLRLHLLDNQEYPLIIRRSRGYVPEPISLPWKHNAPVVMALGAEMHTVGAIGIGKRVFPTQHIGHLSTLENIEFLKLSMKHMRSLLGIEKIQGIGGDLHPQFSSTTLGKEWSEKADVPFFQFQHHFAHLSALAIDAGVHPEETIICAALDGTGYGEDGTIWGGEILMGNYSNFERVAHLEVLSIPGGDLAIKQPHRAFLANLLSFMSSEEVTESIESLPWLKWITDSENYSLLLNSLSKQLKNHNISSHNLTSSCGRVLDILSVMLGVTKFRTYEGEPAIKLESFSKNKISNSELTLEIPYKKNSVGSIEIQTKELLQTVWYGMLEGKNKYLLAQAAERSLAKTIADVSILMAERHGREKIGMSGGVCYNQAIFSEFYRNIVSAGKKYTPIYHKQIPCGDGCISIGQVPLIQAKLI
ncbi:MAG: carbamoyltransferase HypF [Candidatus Hodarchaeales archaeon]